MTEDQIERIAERTIDRLDRQFLSGKLTQKQYDEGIAEVDKWANQQRFAGRPS